MTPTSRTTTGGFLPLTQAATFLGKSYRALQRLISRGEINAVRSGEQGKRARFIAVDELNRWLAEHGQEPVAELGACAGGIGCLPDEIAESPSLGGTEFYGHAEGGRHE